MDSIQALRALAAVAVVTHHVSLFGNGAWGVDLFFVISGFIMCYVTRDSSESFLARRVIRIVPLYWAGTILVFLVALLAPRLVFNTTTDAVALVKSLAFIPFRKGIAVEPVLFLGWSLNYEMFFYALFALSMVMSRRHRALTCSVLIAAIVVLGWISRPASVPLGFFSDPTILEFVFGMLCYAIYARTTAVRPPPARAARVAWTLAGAILIACLPLATLRIADVHHVVRHGIPAAFALCFVVHGLSGLRLPWPIVAIGDASYSLYLFHPYVIYLWDRVFGAFAVPDLPGYVMAGSAVVLCCVLAVLFYRYVERPVTVRLRRRFDHAPTPRTAAHGGTWPS